MQVSRNLRIGHNAYREGSSIKTQKVGIVYNNGGIGDYVNWTPAIKCVVETQPQLYGYIVCPEFFAPLAKQWFLPYADRFEVIAADDFNLERRIYDTPLIVPKSTELVNAIGAHLFNLGFHYYMNTDTIPEGYRELPRITGGEVSLEKFNLPEKYCVVTVTTTSPTRELPGKTVNEISNFCREEGYTPVFLGKAKILFQHNSRAPEDFDPSLGIDLREKTDLLEAAVILANAKFVVGLDNGLLHLACCSKVPVVFGLTTAHPKHRIPPRQEFAVTKVVVPPETLDCRFCQSQMKYLIGHSFHQCYYEDNLCCKQLTAESFIKEIKEILK